MNTPAKKPFTPAPRMNILKDQLKDQRFGLINKVKVLREQRQALKGVKGSGQQWAELCAQIDELQAKIDLLSKSLGLPVKDRNVLNAALTLEGRQASGSSPCLYTDGKTATDLGYKLAPSIADKPQHHQKHSPEGRVDLVGNQGNSWDDHQSTPEDFK
ncbi:hypothetical protein AH04_177 [Erwinia phage AH04]|uniref:Uncharacterized protein n=1 Tax=Erwinia phage AH04 TaxID=2869569 RepID=A0AAE8BUS2_9CAUD|nr:hypothetical protein PQC02_gp137 [Erwinia phage AH04]QZA70652.1 hypothetical protein AH04_177 [Erwinia phage AH04]